MPTSSAQAHVVSGTSRPLRIGIVGAGLVGSCASIALSRLGNAEVKTFEKSQFPREAGAWISLTVTGLRVLNELIPTEEINRITYRPPDRAAYVTRHWRTGNVILQRYSNESLGTSLAHGRTHREPLLRLLLNHVPEEVITYGTRVINVVADVGKGVQLQFDDGKSETFDLVVAADGIYSPTRRLFYPEHSVTFKGAVAYRCIFPISLISDVKGLHDDTSCWRKDGEAAFLSEVGLGMYGIVIIRGEDPVYAAKLHWERSIGKDGVERLRRLYQDWDPLILHVLNHLDDIQAYPLDSGPWLRSLVKNDYLAFIGDAAHPTAGAYGAGAAMGFGDSWALYRALQDSRSNADRPLPEHGYDISRALRVFNEARAPFLARVEAQMDLDRADARYTAEASADEEEWIRRFKELNPESGWLTEHNVEDEVQRAILVEGSKE